MKFFKTGIPIIGETRHTDFWWRNLFKNIHLQDHKGEEGNIKIKDRQNL
jgi:hypothetical protein